MNSRLVRLFRPVTSYYDPPELCHPTTRFAEQNGLKAVGTLRLLAEGAFARMFSLPEAFARLKHTNFRASERLYAAPRAETEARR